MVGNGCIRHTSCLFRTGEGGFRHRISLPYRKRLFFTPNAFENASRTPGCLFLHRMYIPYTRGPSPVPNAKQPPPPKHKSQHKRHPLNKFRVRGTQEMVEGAGANKVSGVRIRGKLLPQRNSKLHKKAPSWRHLCEYTAAAAEPGVQKKEATSIGDLFGDACRIQTYDLLIRSQMLYSAELRRQSHTGEPVLYYYSTSFIRPRLASLMRAFLPARARM